MALRFVGELYSGKEGELLLPIIGEESCDSEKMGGLKILVHFLPSWAEVSLWALFCNVTHCCGLNGLDLSLFRIWVGVDKGLRFSFSQMFPSIHI